MKVAVDPTRCQGHLRCCSVAPDYFDMDDQGFAVVKVGKGTDSAAVAAFVAAAEACPERAIHLDE